ncbi:SDR family NAD(P)-dependent oxidoreductase [Nocardioides sp. LHG3406-4]|uniref:SDR family NAD(P)-dependent oxidoreductase n=1 Tax=Nocardioides sp. LHG3406-4 TaxID=2804575 RepID=UPI003CEEEFE2
MARVLVTGADGGLGRALVEAFRERGDDVLSTDLRGADLVLDVTSDADWAAARAHVEQTWGGLDILVNNAGIAGGGRLDHDTVEEWQHLVDINLLGAVRGIKTFVPVFKAQRSGHVVNIASLAGLVPPAGMASYNATKAAVVALTETTGHELAGHGVRASVVCPSYFRSGLADHLTGSDGAVGAVVAKLVKESPWGPDDIARAVIEGIERGDELILPDQAARAAYTLKTTDRATYDAMMRAQARKLEERARG